MHLLSSSTSRLTSIAAAVVLAAGSSHAQWTVTNLHPEGAEESAALATDGSKQAGVTVFDGVRKASLWNGKASSLSLLAPDGATMSEVTGTTASDQVGAVVLNDGASRASLWQGTSESWIDLNPSDVSESWASASDSDRQVGWVHIGGVDQASLWAGTMSSRVSLHPMDAIASRAYDISGDVQVGWVQIGDSQFASLWNDSSFSWVNLDPSVASSSAAYGVHGNQQVGYAVIDGAKNASLWTGSAESWVNLHPEGASSSEVFAVFEGWQVGQVVIDGIGRAAIWSGTADSFENLAEVLPTPEAWGETTAEGLWITGDTISVVGYGFNTATNRNEALLWSRPAPVPAPTIFPDGGVSENGFQVAITTAVADATVRYSADGSDVTADSAVYSAPLTINSDTSVQARAFTPDREPSAAAYAYFAIGNEELMTYSRTDLTPKAFQRDFVARAVASADPPTIDPLGGAFVGSVDVALSVASPNDVIRFTLDGSPVTQFSQPYVAPISVTQDTTVSARNFSNPADSENPSATSVGVFTITPAGVAALAPTFEPASGSTFLVPIQVAITAPTPGSTVRFTTDGLAPNGNSAIYDGPISVASSTTIRAQAFAPGLDPSPIISAIYSINRQVPLPTILPAGGDVTGVILVRIQIDAVPLIVDGQSSTTNVPVEYRYTVDGSEVTSSSPLYSASAPLAIDRTTTLNVRGFALNYVASNQATATFTVTPAGIAASAPVITPASEFISSSTDVGISSDIPGAQIRYTTNGDTVTATSAVFDSRTPLRFATNTTLKARVYAQGLDPSPEVSKSFIVDAASAVTPVITPNGGVFEGSVLVELATTTQGATIRYTLDGTPPTDDSPIYTGPFSLPDVALDIVNPPFTVTTRAFAPGRIPSDLASATFTIIPASGTAIAPTISPASGAYIGVVNVSIASENPQAGGIIRYAIDGPVTGTSPIYPNDPKFRISLTASAVLNAVEFVPGQNPSRVATVSYTINPAGPAASISATPGSGSFVGSVLVSLTSNTPGAVIRFTTDGTDVTSNSPIYQQALTFLPDGALPNTTTLKAVAFAEGFIRSLQLVEIYDVSTAGVELTVPNPVITPNGGTYQAGTRVTLTLPKEFEPLNPTIRYTMDGSPVLSDSPIFDPNNPIVLLLANNGAVINARAFADGYNPSRTITSSAFTITPNQTDAPTVAPQILPNGGIFRGSVPVILSGPGTTVRYTTDGSPVTQFSELYSVTNGPIWVDSNATINARAFSNLNPSETVTAVFEIIPAEQTAVAPSPDPLPGNYPQAVAVQLTSPTEGAVIRYTVNGSGVTGLGNATDYNGPIPISATSAIRARAFANGYNPSPQVEATYNIVIPVNTNIPPVFVPGPGVFPGMVTVTLVGAGNIHYTTNGDDVTQFSEVYTGPLSLVSTQTIKARVFGGGLNPSTTAQATFVVEPSGATAEAPVLEPAGGNYNRSVSVSLVTTTPGSVIRYTINGADVTAADAVYTGPIPISDTSTIRARVFADGFNPSPQVEATYFISASPLPTPTIRPNGGSFAGSVPVEIVATPVLGALVVQDLYYTTNGDDVTVASTPYTGPLLISENTTVKARAFPVNAAPGGPNYAASATAESVFTITQAAETAPAPVITPNGGAITSATQISLTSSRDDAQIRYTTDNSPVTSASTLYNDTTPITLAAAAATTIKARTFVPGLNPSDEVQATFTVDQQAPPPVISPVGGAFEGTVNIEITSTIPSFVGEIRYTVNGQPVTTTSPVYTGPISLPVVPGAVTNQPIVVTAQAFSEGSLPSASVAESFQIAPSPGTAFAPEITPASGNYQGSVLVSIASEMTGAIIRYTTDATPVTGGSPIYTGPLNVATDTVVRSAVFVQGLNASAETTATYTVAAAAQTTATPVILPVGGAYSGSVLVSLASATPGATIRYTLDGSAVNNESPIYIEPFSVFSTGGIVALEVSAQAFADGFNPSAIAEDAYTVTPAVASLTAARPVITPVGGTYQGGTQITLFVPQPQIPTTESIVIRYTTDGSPVTGTSPIYTNETPIFLDEDFTLTARTFINGYNPSGTSQAAFIAGPNVTSDPVIIPNGGIFFGSVPVLIAGGGATIHYTTDGSPVTQFSPQYDPAVGSIWLSETTTLKARAFSALNASGTVEATFEVRPSARTAAAPVFDPVAGNYAGSVDVEITTSTPGSVIRYTINGEDVTGTSPQYTGPIAVSDTSTIRARVYATGFNPSPQVDETYFIGAVPLPTPTIRPNGGTFAGVVPVEIAARSVFGIDQDIYYTTNGDDVTLASTLYTGPILIAEDVTIKARSFQDGTSPFGSFLPSEQVEVAFTITQAAETAPTPVITPGGGIIAATQQISIANGRDDAQIRYTTDGTDVNTGSLLYSSSAPLTLSGNATVKAVAYIAGQNPSAQAEATFTVIAAVATPQILPSGSSFYQSVTVSLRSATPGAQIYYTTNGSVPTIGSTLYTGPFTLTSNATVNAIAVFPGIPASAVATATFAITPAVAPPTSQSVFAAPSVSTGNPFAGGLASIFSSSRVNPFVGVRNFSPTQTSIQALQRRIVDVRRRVQNPVARANQIRRLNQQIQRLRAQEFAATRF